MKFFAVFTALAAVASAHPFEAIFGRDTCVNPNRVVTFVIDNSASNGYAKENIKGSDPNGLRFDGARKLIAAMTPGKDQASVVTFTTRSKVLVGNTDVGNIHFSNPDIGGLTTMEEGVKGGADQLHAAGNIRDRSAMIFYSDGRDSDSILRPKLVPGKLQALANEGVRIHWAQLNVDGEKRQPPGVAEVAFHSGGIYAEVNDAASLTKFIDQVLGKGITNGDCHNNGGNPGGPIEEGVITHGICSNNVQAVYTYTPQRKEKIDIDLALLTTKNKVNLNVVLENKATGEKKEGNVNSGNAKQTISVSADKGQQITVTVSPSNASNDECEYTVSLRTTADSTPEPSSSSTQPEPTPSSSSTQPEPTPSSSSTQPEPTPSSSSTQPEPTPSSSSSKEPEPTPSSSSTQPEPTPSSSSTQPEPTPSSSTSKEPEPTPSSSSTQPEPTPSSSSTSPEPTTSATSCPAPPEPTTQTVTSTVVTTVTAPAPSSTASVCICKCDAPGAKPMPKFEL
ncbi:restin-like protein [Trichosporon asahii var. asahii CBS 8904]|uniref:Restin-like protein n=2 Tax=Trichosporon asahii var. asahii TaxID=189963 RepID=K1VKR7_TRIAC|nr:restin-like protein [Trichosporon asahii var. asahii CBS 2479]EJT45834.1 restin-like protein [Trichosporon asahii var. asahii CBS 2479]EKC99826.1 restin-like protein [Trichosporon asahii var. asahii CBS 8904]